MVAALALPLGPAQSADVAQVLIARMRRSFSVAVSPDARTVSRRDGHAFYSMGSQRIVAAALVVGSIQAGLLDGSFHLREQKGQRLGIGDSRIAGYCGYNLPALFLHREMKLSPGAPLSNPVLTHLPLALSKDFEPAGINGQVERFAGFEARCSRKLARQALAAAAKRAANPARAGQP